MSMNTGLLMALALLTVPVASQSGIPRCLQSREDFVPCLYQNADLRRAQENQYSVHSTRIRPDETGRSVECNVRSANQIIRDITDLGTEEMRVLYSPGFTTREQYEKELRVEYLVQCEEDELAFYNITSLDTQSKEDCQTIDGRFRCQDYLQIVGPSGGVVEECGTTPSESGVLQLESGNLTVVFRTSEDSVVGNGFQMYIICYKPAETSLEDCVNGSEFTSGVCAAENDTSNSVLLSETKRSVGSWYPRRQDEPPIASFYTDLFPNSGFPPNLRIRQDLAEFHQQWNRLRGKPGAILFEVNVLPNQGVNFSKKSIHLLDSDGNILTTYCIVEVLQTFNSDGVVDKYVGRVRTNRNPHFRGPGLLAIVNRRAYFQLFWFDPRGTIPNVEEQRELLSMNTPLLDSIFNNTLNGLRIPRATDPDFTESDTEAVLAALRSENSCNAVLRAQSRATLTFFSERDPNYVESLRTFNITCFLATNGSSVMCTSDSVTLPERTLCQIDGQIPDMCDPFREQFEVLEATNVTITTLNCAGQTAISEIILQEK